MTKLNNILSSAAKLKNKGPKPWESNVLGPLIITEKCNTTGLFFWNLQLNF